MILCPQNARAGYEAQQELYEALLQLMVDDRSDKDVSLFAATVLSQLGLHQDSCHRHLRNVLSAADPLHQFTVSQ